MFLIVFDKFIPILDNIFNIQSTIYVRYNKNYLAFLTILIHNLNQNLIKFIILSISFTIKNNKMVIKFKKIEIANFKQIDYLIQ